jgi:hypothetical protein
MRALGIAHPSPTLRDIADLDQYASQFDHLDASPFRDGVIAGHHWLTGSTPNAPLTQSPPLDLAHPAPDAQVVHAEAAYATGVIYLDRSDYAAGIETMLVYATSPG